MLPVGRSSEITRARERTSSPGSSAMKSAAKALALEPPHPSEHTRGGNRGGVKIRHSRPIPEPHLAGEDLKLHQADTCTDRSNRVRTRRKTPAEVPRRHRRGLDLWGMRPPVRPGRSELCVLAEADRIIHRDPRTLGSRGSWQRGAPPEAKAPSHLWPEIVAPARAIYSSALCCRRDTAWFRSLPGSQQMEVDP